MDLRRLKLIKASVSVASERRPRQRERRALLSGDGGGQTEEERVTHLLEQLVGSHRMLITRTLRCLVVALGGVLVLAGCLFLWQGILLRNTFLTMLSIPCGLVGAIFICCMPIAVTRQRLALYQLTGYNDIRAIAPLTQALSSPDRKLRHAARIALTRLLPLLTNPESQNANLSGTLTPECWARLEHHATPHNASRYPEFVCALVPALMQSREPRAVETIRQLAATPPQNRAQQAVHATVLACLTPPAPETETQPLLITQTQRSE